MNIDVVIVSYAKNENLKKETIDCLTSLFESEEEIEFYPYIVESNKKVDYSNIHPNIKMIYPDVEFGYHRYLNIGRKEGKSEYVCLCNNDLVFNKKWATNILKVISNKSDVMSASPYSENPHKTKMKLKPMGVDYGYRVRRHLAGWCIFQKRKIYDIIGDLDERYVFWYCDNDYAETIKRKGIKHAFVKNSIVEHVESKTLNTMNSKTRLELTKKQIKIFKDKWGN